MIHNKDDIKTAQAFSNSWNNLPKESVYTFDQFIDWFNPLTENDIKNKRVLELGCGNASLLIHLQKWNPSAIVGVDLGDSVYSANINLSNTDYRNFKIIKADLTNFNDGTTYDLVYSIGVLHHLNKPEIGFDSVVKNTRPGGKFHCWVYAREGNTVIVYFVDPIRKLVCHFPWWINKYLISTPLAFIFFLYAHLITLTNTERAPLYQYCKWICRRKFSFFRHVVFDQLVTPVTHYISRERINGWLSSNPKIDQDSTYIIFRNGNSWKFGGSCK